MPKMFSNEAAELNVLLQNDLVMLKPTMLCTSLSAQHCWIPDINYRCSKKLCADGLPLDVRHT